MTTALDVSVRTWDELMQQVERLLIDGWRIAVPEGCHGMRLRVRVRPRLLDPVDRSAVVDPTGPSDGAESLMAAIRLFLRDLGTPFKGEVWVAVAEEHAPPWVELWHGQLLVREHGPTARDLAEIRRVEKAVRRDAREDRRMFLQMFAKSDDIILASGAAMRARVQPEAAPGPQSGGAEPWLSLMRLGTQMVGLGGVADNPPPEASSLQPGGVGPRQPRRVPACEEGSVGAANRFTWRRRDVRQLDVTSWGETTVVSLTSHEDGVHHLQGVPRNPQLWYEDELCRPRDEESGELALEVKAWVKKVIERHMGPGARLLDICWLDPSPEVNWRDDVRRTWDAQVCWATTQQQHTAQLSWAEGGFVLALDGGPLATIEYKGEPRQTLPEEVRIPVEASLTKAGILPARPLRPPGANKS